MQNWITITHQDLIYLLTGRTFVALGRALHRNFKQEGIDVSQEQWTVLSELWQEEGLTQHELAARTYRDKPAITRLIDNLEKKDLVRREAHESDRRVNLIFLTEKGHRMEAVATEIVHRTITEAIDGIPEEDLLALKRTLYRVFDNLNR
ncbi:MAG: MarR family transcriptional regulator [Bacteroidia bacterium]|nr:MarR family transcriptional regulator [Bacteroidia bacterium]